MWCVSYLLRFYKPPLEQSKAAQGMLWGGKLENALVNDRIGTPVPRPSGSRQQLMNGGVWRHLRGCVLVATQRSSATKSPLRPAFAAGCQGRRYRRSEVSLSRARSRASPSVMKGAFFFSYRARRSAFARSPRHAAISGSVCRLACSRVTASERTLIVRSLGGRRLLSTCNIATNAATQSRIM